MKYRVTSLPVLFGLAGFWWSLYGYPVAAATSWHKVASVDVERPDQCGFVVAAASHYFSTSEISAEVLPASAAERAALFDVRLEFAFAGLNPAAQYQVRASFLSDSDGRVEKIEAGDAALEERLALPWQKVLSKTWDVPSRAVAAGKLTLTFASLAGPSAVISCLEVWSSDPTLLKSTPPAVNLAEIAVPVPRVSPRPLAVAGLARPMLSLNGRWKFEPAAPENTGQVSAGVAGKWKDIQVPGEWAMEGFKVEKDHFACYFREFVVPADWAGHRLKLRFDTVHSECRIWVNGKEVGGHEGGFVAFELDVTAAAGPGVNSLAVAVKSESVSDELDSATQYAGHQLGGITRKVTLFAVPQINIATEVLTTKFDAAFKNATLNYHLEIANDLPTAADTTLRFELIDPEGKPVEIPSAQGTVRLWPALPPAAMFSSDGSIAVAAPRQWDTEHPNLYTLRTELSSGRTAEVITQRFGFRQVEVRGNQVFVNNHPIKLHGVCRHETHPLLGRSLTPQWGRTDAEIFRAANVNYIRTSHYPPAEEFLDACDELGLFVECESALCWVQFSVNPIWAKWNYRDPKFLPYLLRANYENVVFNRHHPSIIIWSLANESQWSRLFAEVQQRMKQLDPSRPTSFHDPAWGGHADIANGHYPGTNGPTECDRRAQPSLFGEYCHVETYNQREHFTDPGVRDQWGPRFSEMYDLMYRHAGCLGGAIWSGIDDAFDLPDGQVEGYGFWGVIDGWRRPKPETFHVRKAYSPIRVTTGELPPGENPLKIGIENRYDFANLREARIAWALGTEKGTVAVDIPAHGAGELVIAPQHKPVEGQVLKLAFTDPRGFVCEAVELPVGHPRTITSQVKPLQSSPLQLETSATAFSIKGGRFACEVDRQTGQLCNGRVADKPVMIGGPMLMILPLDTGPCQPQDLTRFGPFNELCQGWQAGSVTAASDADGSILVKVEGKYAEAEGSYTLRFQPGGELELTYDFSATKAINPRQVGMVLWLAGDCDTLHWERRAEWSGYPADHIGRPLGEAKANPNAAKCVAHFATAPQQAWSADTTALGTADFRSSKSHVLSAALRSAQGRGVALVSDGAQTVRTFVAGDRIGWLIACINAGGGDNFFSTHLAPDRHPLKKGSRIADTIHLQLTAN